MLALLYEWLSPQGIIAVGVIYTAVEAWRARRAAAGAKVAVAVVSAKVETVAAKVEEVHLATNGMSHRIETLAGQVGVAEGREQMRAETEAKKP